MAPLLVSMTFQTFIDHFAGIRNQHDSRHDVETLVRDLHSKVKKTNCELRHLHMQTGNIILPSLLTFGCSLLLGDKSYQSNLFPKSNRPADSIHSFFKVAVAVGLALQKIFLDSVAAEAME